MAPNTKGSPPGGDVRRINVVFSALRGFATYAVSSDNAPADLLPLV